MLCLAQTFIDMRLLKVVYMAKPLFNLEARVLSEQGDTSAAIERHQEFGGAMAGSQVVYSDGTVRSESERKNIATIPVYFSMVSDKATMGVEPQDITPYTVRKGYLGKGIVTLTGEDEDSTFIDGFYRSVPSQAAYLRELRNSGEKVPTGIYGSLFGKSRRRAKIAEFAGVDPSVNDSTLDTAYISAAYSMARKAPEVPKLEGNPEDGGDTPPPRTEQ